MTKINVPFTIYLMEENGQMINVNGRELKFLWYYNGNIECSYRGGILAIAPKHWHQVAIIDYPFNLN